MRLDKWFGKGSKQPERAAQQPQMAPQAKLPEKTPEQKNAERLAQFDKEMEKNEPALSTRATSEAFESPRVIRLHQLKFGKHVAEKNGPIQPGVGYRFTGGPEDMSVDGLKGDMHPHRMSFGTSDLTNWSQVPFQPIVRVTRIYNGVPYVICGKVQGRSEKGVSLDGKQKPGRPYVEGHFIAIPASEWSVALIPQLESILDTTPRVVGEPDRLPQLEAHTDNLDQALPEGWFDQLTKDMIVRVASGQSISIRDWKMPQNDSLDHIFRTELCLPEEIARRMSFGSGVADKSDSKEFGLRVYHGMTQTTGRPALRPGNPWDADDAEKNKLGEEYLAALTPLIDSAKTPRDVMKAVTQLLPDLVERVSKRVYPQ